MNNRHCYQRNQVLDQCRMHDMARDHVCGEPRVIGISERDISVDSI